jgi:hypothetical protein
MSISRRQVPLIEKFRCNVCEKVKSPNLYSQRELDKYRILYLRGKRPTFENAKLRCRTCTGDVRAEMPCKGYCGLYKPIDEFSKSARLTGGSGVSSLLSQEEELQLICLDVQGLHKLERIGRAKC